MTKENDHAGLFGLGQANTAYQQYFKGQSYLHSLVGAENEIDVHVANVTFEPGCRNNWHIHHHGFQILLVQVVKAGTKKLVNRRKNYIQAMLSRFTKVSNIGTGPQKIIG